MMLRSGSTGLRRAARIQAILAYIKIMNGKNPRFGPILDEAKHTYEQALSFYEGRDFEGALEFAPRQGSSPGSLR